MEQTDYKELYEQAKERAKHNLTYAQVEEIFPEPESEDERIRKDLIIYLRSVLSNKKYGDKFIESWIDWLEKQGEKTSDKIVEKARTEKQRVLLTETDGSANIDWDCRSLDDVKTLLKCGLEFIRTIEADKQILTDSRFGGCSIHVPTRYDKGIKQGEQILANSAKTCKDEQKPIKERNVCDFCEDRYGCVNHCPMRLIEEEKPADKVEPKFREGDSIQFKGFGHNRYTIKEVCGLSHYINTMGNSMDMSYTDANFEVIKDPDKVEISTVWSEEDERIRKSLSAYFAKFKPDDMWDADFSFGDIVAWFENQGKKGANGNDREIPFDAWSEEDERMCTKTILALAGFIGNEDKLDWLKSLKNRYIWKPSDLPHWKKSTLPNDNTTGFNSDYFCHKGYNINYKELFEKLPKDD